MVWLNYSQNNHNCSDIYFYNTNDHITLKPFKNVPKNMLGTICANTRSYPNRSKHSAINNRYFDYDYEHRFEISKYSVLR